MSSLTILLRRMKHQIVFSLLALLCLRATHAQVLIDQTFSIEEYVNDVLLGSGVTASNITYIGDPVQLGKMDDTTGVFSLESGLVLARFGHSHDPRRVQWTGQLIESGIYRP